MNINDFINLNEKNTFQIQEQNTTKGYAGADELKEGASAVASKVLAGRAGVFFLILALLFLSVITRTRPVIIIFIVVTIIGVFHNELLQWFLYLTKYFGFK